MRLFTYRCKENTRYARQVGSLGIDLEYAVMAYQNETEDPVCFPADFTLAGILDLQKEQLELLEHATDWVQENYQGRDKDLWQGIVFEWHRVELLAPVPAPGKVICIAGNYPTAGQPTRPQSPTIFLKPSSGINGHAHPVILPALAQNVAYEVELAIVIGKTCRLVTRDQARQYIAGFTVANDIGDRVLEKRTSQWTSGKMFDTFTPMGPFLVTCDELPDTGQLAMVTRLNGKIVQKGSTAEMFFPAEELVSIVSELTTLHPGDLILTGSPKLMDGKPAEPFNLKPGDQIEVEVGSIGKLENPIVAEDEKK